MSKIGAEGRSYHPISLTDLQRLAKLAHRDRKDFFRRYPRWAKAYASRLICVALCQGAAKHYVDGTTGINDFDVYTFYRAHPQKQWYPKRRKSYDFGDPKFGHSTDRPDFLGRRVDCFGRAINTDKQDRVSVLRRYLREGKTKTARLLAGNAVVLLEPKCGMVVWPLKLDEKGIVNRKHKNKTFLRSTSETGISLVTDRLLIYGAHDVTIRKEGNKSKIIASNANRTRTIYISTRTRTAGTWQTSIDYGQPSEEKKDETNFWVFVDLTLKDPQFYIVPEWWIINNIHEVYQEYLSRHGGERSRTGDSKHHAIAIERIEQWHNRWNLLGIF